MYTYCVYICVCILQVHGGTSDKDIIKFIQKAEVKGKENRAKNLDTVVFFDEANTTDAIGLIKEIMCDRRLHGSPVSEDLKFIAACNPYRRLLLFIHVYASLPRPQLPLCQCLQF